MNNDRDNAKLDIISGIDEDIIERNSAKRYKLSHRKRGAFAKKYVIIAVAAILAVCLLAGAGIATFMWFGDDTPVVEDPYLTSDGRKVPIYQGMTVSKKAPTSSARAQDYGAVRTLSLSERPAINVNDPFGNLETTGGIEAAAKEAIVAQPSSEKIYYAEKYEDIYITIHVNNPDSVEILSFTLNGKKYSSYMFEEGSNLENLVLKCNVGGVAGMTEYTIDAIKYIDGTEIKDVRMEGDRTVKVGVYTENQPVAHLSNMIAGFNDLNFIVKVDDPVSLISKEEEKLFAIIYDGERILDKKAIPTGEEVAVEFTGLSSNTVYQYAIAAAYDALDGEGERVHILAQNSFYTAEVLALDEFVLTDTTLDFSIAWAESITNKTLISASLWHDDAKMMDLSIDDRSISGLVSGEKYSLVLHFYNDEVIEKLEIPFRTVKNATPAVSVKVRKIGSDSVTFEIIESDSSKVGVIEKIELLKKNGESIFADDLDSRAFEDLAPNSPYMIRITYTYDLKDGNGPITITRNASFTTSKKTAPSVSVSHRSAGYDWIEFTLDVSDPDGIYEISKIELLHGNDAPVVSDNLNSRIFTGLVPGNTYTVQVYYTYDLGEGDPPVSKTASTVMFTRPYIKPSLRLSIQDRDLTSVNFNLTYTDDDSVGQIDSIELLLDGEVVQSTEDITVRGFSGLEPCGMYTIKVWYSYDLKDGLGTRSECAVIGFRAQSPGLAVSNGVVTGLGTCTDSTIYINMPIATGAFRNENDIVKVVLGKDVTYISNEAFAYCKYLEQIELPEGLTKIGQSCFMGCGSLTSIKIPSTVRAIDECAFQDCYSLERVELPEGLTSIGASAFISCGALNEITLPSSLRSIGNGAFWNVGCNDTGMRYLVIPKGVESIGEDAFGACSHLTVYTPYSVRPSGWHKSWNGVDSPARVEWSFKQFVTDGEFKCVELNDGSKILIEYSGEEENIVIPEGITAIKAGLFANNGTIVSVTLPTTLKEIGESAFESCGRLVSVKIPAGVTDINASTFAYCERLESVELPSTLKTIGEHAFYFCYKLTGVVLPNGLTTIGQNAFGHIGNNVNRADMIVIPESVTKIGENAFEYCDNLTIYASAAERPSGWHKNWNGVNSPCKVLWNFSRFITEGGVKYIELNGGSKHVVEYDNETANVTILGGVTTIPRGIFSDSKVLESIVLPEGVTLIEASAFANCENLSTVKLPTTLKEIGNSAFENCDSIEEIRMPDALTSLGEFAFANCDNLELIVFSKGLRTLPLGCFRDCIALETVVIPEGITAIGNEVFSNCNNIVSVSLPTTLTEIGESAFADCRHLSSIRIPEGIVDIKDYTFAHCERLESVVLPSTLKTIGKEAFIGCNLLLNVVLPDGLTTIDEAAFQHLGVNASVNDIIIIPASVTSMGNRVFDYCYRLTVYVSTAERPSGWRKNWLGSEEPCSVVWNFKQLVTEGNFTYSEFNDGSKLLIAYSGNEENVIVPEGISAIGKDAFAGNDKIVSVTLPATLEAIGDRAFINCSKLTSINLPSALKVIGESAFNECRMLSGIVLPDGLTTIGRNAFWQSGYSAPAYKMIIPASVTEIGENAFEYCHNLTVYVSVAEKPEGWHDNWSGENSSRKVVWNFKQFGTIGQFTYAEFNDGSKMLVEYSGNDANVVIPEGITSMGSRVFEGNDALVSVAFPSTLKEIGEGAFMNCRGLTSISIPSTIKVIGENAFYDCYMLSKVVISEGVETIAPRAFWGVGVEVGYRSVMLLPDSVTKIGEYAFEHCHSLTVYTSKSERPDGWDVTWYGKDTPCEVVWNLKQFSTSGSFSYAEFNDGSKSLMEYTGNETTVVIPEGVTDIADGAFEGNRLITSVELPSTLKSIGERAFKGCSALNNVLFPTGLVYIGPNAFEDCDSLESIEI
ncbi:MAG: leucine-rich repeat protein, partial [Clostridia bacterium]|nr:leucine-rich repeat protein [Clostridia bacterium]